MASTFAGFSEEDLMRMKSGDDCNATDFNRNISNFKKLDRIGAKPKRVVNQYKLPIINKLDSDEVDNIEFSKCKLSLKSPNSPHEDIGKYNDNQKEVDYVNESESYTKQSNVNVNDDTIVDSRKSSTDVAPDIIKSLDNYTEDETTTHEIKLNELQLKQKLMEEQNKKRKEMLAKALADRTKQTEEEVMRLEKIKRELQILDGQFSQDVAVLRKKIDQACLSYAEAEKHYLRIEKEFLQAKINLQKEKEKKELLTEHLCALITHNEMRKAKKLETLMLELASDKKTDIKDPPGLVNNENSVIVDGVDERTGKIVEMVE